MLMKVNYVLLAIAIIERPVMCSFEEEERQENDDQAKRGHSSIPDRGG